MACAEQFAGRNVINCADISRNTKCKQPTWNMCCESSVFNGDLELSRCSTMSWRQLRILVITTVVMVSLCVHPNVGRTYAMFDARYVSATNDFVGATFSPSVAPTISARDTGNAITVTWPVVSISSGVAVSYEIVRHSGGVAQVVCTAPGAITFVATTSTMQCRDDTVQSLTSYTYTEQPYVMAGGVRTWSLAPSSPSAAACLKKCR